MVYSYLILLIGVSLAGLCFNIARNYWNGNLCREPRDGLVYNKRMKRIEAIRY
jgi:hypothetical protein